MAGQNHGIEVGAAAAAAIIALRTGDGSTRSLLDSTTRRATSLASTGSRPAIPVRFAPGWGASPRSRCDGAQFRPGQPYKLTSHKYAARPRRGEAPRRGRHHHPQRPHGRADRDRAVLGREFTAGVEPDRADCLGQTEGSTCGRTRDCSACSTSLWRMATSPPSTRSTTILLAPGHRHPTGRHRRQSGHVGDPTWTPLVTIPIPDYDSGHASKAAQQRGF